MEDNQDSACSLPIPQCFIVHATISAFHPSGWEAWHLVHVFTCYGCLNLDLANMFNTRVRLCQSMLRMERIGNIDGSFHGSIRSMCNKDKSKVDKEFLCARVTDEQTIRERECLEGLQKSNVFAMVLIRVYTLIESQILLMIWDALNSLFSPSIFHTNS